MLAFLYVWGNAAISVDLRSRKYHLLMLISQQIIHRLHRIECT